MASQNHIKRHIGIAINRDTYTDNCLAKKLVPYLSKLPKNIEHIFWLDLASAHYSKKAVQFLKDQNIKFLPNLKILQISQNFVVSRSLI